MHLLPAGCRARCCCAPVTPARPRQQRRRCGSSGTTNARCCSAPVTPSRPRHQRRRCGSCGTTAAAAAAPAAASQQQQAAAFNSLAAWLTSAGGSVDPALTSGEVDMGGALVRGLIVTASVPAGTPLLSVPLAATLRDDAAPAPYPDAPWNARLAAALLDELELRRHSRLAPYLEMLPAHCDSPLLLPAAGVAEVQYPAAMAAIKEHAACAWQAHAACCDARSAAGRRRIDWQDWAWAQHNVQSRSIRLAIAGCKVMIPGIDLLNHGGLAANGQLVLGSASWQVQGEPSICFITTQPIQAGEQVLWSYGVRRGNDDFFCYHGFALPDNADEDVLLWEDAPSLACWALEQLPGLAAAAQQQGASQAQLLAAAEAAAASAHQEASAHCSDAAIPGTSSSLLLSAASLQQQLAHAGAAGAGARLSAVLSAVKGLQLQRRLASFRLHRPDWGTSSCPAVAPELVLRRDGAVDVRIAAVVAALQDALQLQQGPSTGEALGQLLHGRCEQLLRGYASSAADDEVWQQQQQAAGRDGSDAVLAALMPAIVTYRLGKKQVLQAQLDRRH